MEQSEEITRALGQAASEEEIAGLLLTWFGSMENDPELILAPGFSFHLARGDCRRAKESLETAFGRFGQSKRIMMDVLEAGARRVRDLRVQAARTAFD